MVLGGDMNLLAPEYVRCVTTEPSLSRLYINYQLDALIIIYS